MVSRATVTHGVSLSLTCGTPVSSLLMLRAGEQQTLHNPLTPGNLELPGFPSPQPALVLQGVVPRG